MNEILTRKYIKKVMKRGITLHTAKEIVESIMEMTKGTGKDFDMYLNYAITLNFGYGFSKQNIK